MCGADEQLALATEVGWRLLRTQSIKKVTTTVTVQHGVCVGPRTDRSSMVELWILSPSERFLKLVIIGVLVGT